MNSAVVNFDSESEAEYVPNGTLKLKDGLWNHIEYRTPVKELADNLFDDDGDPIEIMDYLKFEVQEPHYGFSDYDEIVAQEYFKENATFEYVDPNQLDMFRSRKP